MIYLIIGIIGILLYAYLEIKQDIINKVHSMNKYDFLKLIIVGILMISLASASTVIKDLKPQAEGVCPEYELITTPMYKLK